ncbi:MAG: PilT/PilU family type 4a pilus ATPase [Candidatus Dadabacteria bacterium]|nr:MAG: PilT/PilU family type 4a pilus ATPase [Candidatus Dadabacteria bacterium]
MLDISKLLGVMIEHDASDLYLTVESPPMYRINGIVRPAGNRLLQPEDTEALANSIMNDKQQREFEEKNEANLGLYYSSLGRFRVNIFRQRGSIGLVIRQIRTNILTIDDLELPPVLKEVAMTKRGLVLVVGATGSGKSTSLAAMVDYRNSNSTGHIITIEDPIEFVHQHKKCIVTQREIGMDTENYHVALKNALRQAPDVILIGEIRDTETMEAAITFAETGHLCFATLHSNNANQAMERIMNFFPPERHKQIYLQLSLNLRGILSQRLVRTKEGGRVAAVEILLDSPRVKDLIHKGEIAELKEAMEKSTNQGMQSFDQALYDLYKDGKITLEEALKNADSQNNLRLRVKLSEEGGFEKKKPSMRKTKKSVDQGGQSSDNRVSDDGGDLKLQMDLN